MGTRFLLDTCAIIKYLNGTFPAQAIEYMNSIIDTELNISIITKIELLSWNPPNPSDLDVYVDFINQSNILFINNTTANQTIQIRKQHRTKLPDALIAATAISQGMTLISDNDKDFDSISNLNYQNPIYQ